MSIDFDEARLRAVLDAFQLELPSWGFSNSGTRFRVFPQPGAPRDAFEKIDDAATVHRWTAATPLVSLHIPWDRVDDPAALAAHAASQGVRIGAVNSNTFQDEDYRLGSLAHPDNAVRRKAMAHMAECCEIIVASGAHALKVWLGDGTNYPGQDDFRSRKRRLQDAVREIHGSLPAPARLLIEYKLYEPAFYHTDIQDWGMALLLAEHAGERARVVVDLGHHAHGVNIEQIVAVLLDEGRLGAFDLNDRKYGDDDLIAGSVNPYQLFLIFNELAAAGAQSDAAGQCARAVSYMVDQSHNIEAKVPAMIHTVMTLQEQWVKAHLVDRAALRAAQQSGDVIDATACLKDAFDTDVRPLLARWREARGLPANPLRAYRESGEAQARSESRREGVPAGWS
ncbi:MAG TPA: L-rhamnose isomerase [Candidatus Angelobacter sp.]|jgi:L-rhamnose isomerase/sugar isomerase|nr:L-rhamnose isomerase [Candidatus Angelobacter sp.]